MAYLCITTIGIFISMFCLYNEKTLPFGIVAMLFVAILGIVKLTISLMNKAKDKRVIKAFKRKKGNL